MAQPVILVEDLTKRYDRVVALKGVSFQVEEGEIFGILGPDGAGKSTLLRLLAGLDRPTSGQIQILGSPPRDPRLRGRVAYMPQVFNLYADLTVWENLQFFGHVFGRTDAREWERLLEIARLSQVRDRLAGRLSGGMKKKLVLITVLVSQPQVLILDEPNTGVDPVSRREIWDLLFEFHQQGMTILIATSYTEEAKRCDRLLLLYQGRSAEVQSPQALKKPLYEKVWRVPTEVSRRHPDLSTLFVIQQRGGWSRLILRPGIPLSKALSFLEQLPTPATPEEPTLEDVLVHFQEAMCQ